jgi:hypothetical protein
MFMMHCVSVVVVRVAGAGRVMPVLMAGLAKDNATGGGSCKRTASQSERNDQDQQAPNSIAHERKPTNGQRREKGTKRALLGV